MLLELLRVADRHGLLALLVLLAVPLGVLCYISRNSFLLIPSMILS